MDDKRTVTVAFTNPSSETMTCETSCDIAVPGGVGTVSCSKQVPASAKDLVLCTEMAKDGVEFSRVKGVENKCLDAKSVEYAAEIQRIVDMQERWRLKQMEKDQMKKEQIEKK